MNTTYIVKHIQKGLFVSVETMLEGGPETELSEEVLYDDEKRKVHAIDFGLLRVAVFVCG